MAKASEKAFENTRKINPGAFAAEEKVEIEIPISETQQDDWFCCINGKTFQIERGKKVMVPRYVKEVYENEKRMTEESIRRSQALQKRMNEKEKNAFS